MFAPSLKRARPLDDVTDPLSEPAKSIMDNLATFSSNPSILVLEVLEASKVMN